MPNFWSKTVQNISEKISGERTCDKDFEQLCEKMKISEKGLAALKTVIQNFTLYNENFRKYFTDINAAMKLLYEGSPYFELVEQILCKHQIIQGELEELNKNITKLFLKTSEWSRIYNSSKELIKDREEKRKIYDHYELKLAKINKNSTKKNEYVERNEAKYSKAASEYVEISEKAFDTINNSLKLSWELTNPVIAEIINIEKKCFDSMSLSLSYFKNSDEKFLEIKNSIMNPNSNRNIFTYDPIKYMNEKDLMKRISLNRNITPFNFTTRPRTSFHHEDSNVNKRSSMRLMERMSVVSAKMDDKKNVNNLRKENLNNIYTNSRLTNSFGVVTTEILEEFYEIEDEF